MSDVDYDLLAAKLESHRQERASGIGAVPRTPPIPADSFLGRVALEQERRRQERNEANRVKVAEAEREIRAAAEAERRRQERNAPAIAKLSAQIRELEAKRAAATRPFDGQLEQLRAQRKALS
jgi:hypothetical protein